jgi:hypothetical protein
MNVKKKNNNSLIYFLSTRLNANVQLFNGIVISNSILNIKYSLFIKDTEKLCFVENSGFLFSQIYNSNLQFVIFLNLTDDFLYCDIYERKTVENPMN